MSKKHPDKNTDFDKADGEEIEVEIKMPESDADGEEVDGDSTAEIEGEQLTEEAPKSLEEQLRLKEDQYLRLAAEFDNFRKRNARQFAQIIESSQADIYTELLTVLDNFRRALEADNGAADFESFRKGVELIYSQLNDFLKKNNVEPFDSVGKKFDPNVHEAMMTVQTDDHKEDTVVKEFEKGYKLRDRILRHARVSVAKPSDENQ
ncbi:MAG: nucleotide exchange factor GrpE [candidate division Zixibacteria bacterium]|nr:nucleotide exchange factor GrpE [candidate division Zixibacteria bacterium]MBU1469937.1 nucleotide exchange factor GrpE [candidate division Zixibacteria bacterium]MBU2626956.1 nucleotide exchange factor GrpE [candidate division Zixibacteria bacterium]